MNKIKILPENIVNRIAAGEVIERPASVLKELMENAIDAEGENIIVQVRDGGRGSIMVSDDGTGMSEEDVLLSIEHHATSKINDYKDLDHITSFGFRGEALSSIASVSLVEIKTALKGKKEGSLVRIGGGVIEEVKKIGWQGGTTINVKNIFYNTPGRRKFLKTKSTEFRHILRTFKQISLAHCEKQFSMYNDDALVWQLDKKPVLQRLETIYGESLVDLVMEVEEKQGGMELYGYIGKPQLVKSFPGEQYLFLNKRYIRDRIINKAIFSGYGSSVSTGGNPFYIIFLKLDPERFDVNVHPAKREVRFKDEREIFDFFYRAVKRRFGAHDISPTPFFYERKGFSSFNKSYTSSSQGAGSIIPMQSEIQYDGREFPAKPALQEDNKEFIEQGKVWQIHNKYIISQIKSGIIILDQHTAHERILYERILKRLKDKKSAESQNLLFPVTVNLSIEDRIVLDDIYPFLIMIGFQINIMNENTAILEGIPSDLRKVDEKMIIKDIIDAYKSDDNKELGIYEKIASSYACRAAIMAGDELLPEEMNNLIDELFAAEFPYFCPHGRPTIIDVPLSEIDKRFLR